MTNIYARGAAVVCACVRRSAIALMRGATLIGIVESVGIFWILAAAPQGGGPLPGRFNPLERQVLESRHALKGLLTADQGGFIR